MQNIEVKKSNNNWIAKYGNILVISTNKYDAIQKTLQIITH